MSAVVSLAKHRRSRAKPVRPSYAPKPVSLPTFAFYDHLPVIYVDGHLVVGRRVIPVEPRR